MVYLQNRNQPSAITIYLTPNALCTNKRNASLSSKYIISTSHLGFPLVKGRWHWVIKWLNPLAQYNSKTVFRLLIAANKSKCKQM